MRNCSVAVYPRIDTRELAQKEGIFCGVSSGATDLFAAYKSGELNSLLLTHDISMKEMPDAFEPASLLPGWLHKR